MSPGGRFERMTDLPFSKLENQVLVVVAKTREVHLLNDSASRIWELLETGTTVQGLLGTLREEYEFPEEGAQAEIEQALTEMVEKGLVRQVPP